MKKVKIIANPNSGRGAALGKILELIELMSRDEYEIELLFTHKEGDGIKFSENYFGILLKSDKEGRYLQLLFSASNPLV